MIIFFFNGLFFGGLGLAAYLQLRQGGDFPLRKHLPCLAAFGFVCGTTYWIDMFLASESLSDFNHSLQHIRMVLQPITGLLLLRFGWGILRDLTPLPAWTIFIPGVMIVPIAFVITFAATTFVTPSPIEIPIDIWTRYLLYLPGSIMAGIGFLRQWKAQEDLGFYDASRLMLGAGLAFLFEYFDKTVKNPEDVELYLGLPVLGTIPKIDKNQKKVYGKSSSSLAKKKHYALEGGK